MKIQRYNMTGRGTMAYAAEGPWAKYADIAHLLPTENPDWEPCEIREAEMVMGANGEVATFSRRTSGALDVFTPRHSNQWSNVVQPNDFPFYGLTPVKRRKVEPVVTLPPLSLSKSPTNIVIVLDDGKQISVTVEVIQGEK